MPGFYAGDASLLDTAGRLLIVAFFLIVGIRNLQPAQVEDHVQRLEAYGPLPYLTATQTFWAGTVLEFIGCALLLLNWFPAIGALCLILFTVLATALMLRFWEVDDPAKRIGMQNGFLANIAVLGGLLLLLQNVWW
jgi:putative oxidoreductase